MFHLFRLGRYLVAGTPKNSDQYNVCLESRYISSSDGWERSSPEMMEVSKDLIINPSFSIKEESIVEETRSTSDIIHESICSILSIGQTRMEETELVAYTRGKHIGIQEDGDISWVHPNSILGSRLGQLISLESLREQLSLLGLVERNHNSLTESQRDLDKPIHVYMKADPFRDITKLNEGVSVSIKGYYKGCAVVEADGEVFWRPIEESSYWDKDNKDDHYYFSLDSNKDNIPDPLQALPSKPALDGDPARSEDNYNTQPHLPKIAGHFSPVPEISNKDYGILESFLATHGFEDFERLHKDEIHDVGVEPGLDAADHDLQVTKHLAKKDQDTEREDDGKDAVDHDYTGEYDDVEPPDDGTDAQKGVQEAMKAIVFGASIDHILSSKGRKDSYFEKEYINGLSKVFDIPGLGEE